jgi:hypothetical protein
VLSVQVDSLPSLCLPGMTGKVLDRPLDVPVLILLKMAYYTTNAYMKPLEGKPL